MTTAMSENGDRLLTVTDRSRNASALRRTLRDQLSTFNITRVAALTGMDVTGLSVYSAVRPRAATISVSAGKGFSADEAWVSAVMESIETAAAESYDPPNKVRGSARSLRVGYSILDLHSADVSAYGDSTVLDWIPAKSLGQIPGQFVPYLACGFRGWVKQQWMPSGLATTSNGIAAGTSAESATAHSLSELIERDTLSRLVQAEDVLRTRATKADFSVQAQELLEKMDCLGFRYLSTVSPGLGGMSVAITYVHSDDMPQVFGGTACSHNVADALSRSLMEALQSRISVISGLRDDISPASYNPDVRPPHAMAPTEEGSSTDGPARVVCTSDLVAAIESHTSKPVLQVTLSQNGTVPVVVQTFAPGLRTTALLPDPPTFNKEGLFE